MRKLFSLLIMLISFSQVYAQTVTGTVQSATDKSGLPGASVVMKRAASEAILTTMTDGQGAFRFERVPSGNYTLEVRFLGYDMLSKPVQVAQAPVNLGVLSMQEQNTRLGEVQIIGRAPLGEQKGDTSQFNAKAFKTAPDASAEDLVTKMPGVQVQDGRIQAQGEEVRQVMIDGKRYTGEDVTSAMRNISSDMIENVQIFDAQSDQAAFSGFDDGNRLKTINFITRKDRRQGYTGKISAGYGTDDRYMAGAAVNYFNNDRRITVTGLTNNINMFDFSIGETPGGGMRGRRGGWGGGSPIGIINTNNFGINYQDKWGKKMDVSANYNYTNRDIINDQYRFRDFVSDDAGLQYTEYADNRDREDGHRLNMRLQYNINENNRLLVTPSLRVQNDNSFTGRNARTFDLEGTLSESLNRASSDNTSFNFNNNILYSKRFGDSGRILTTNFNTSINNVDGDGYQFEQTENFENPDRNVLRDQYIRLDRKNFSWSGSTNYSQRLGEKSRWQLEYSIGNQMRDSDRRTYDYMETAGGYTNFNTPLSSTFKSDYLSQNIGPSYQYRDDKARLQLNARYQYATLNTDSQFPVDLAPLERKFNNFLPSAEYEYKFSNSQNLTLNFRTSTNVPSVEQLQEVLDISNPLQARIGNADLDQDYQSRLNIRYRNFNAETNRVFFIGMFGTMTNNYVANSVYTTNVPEGIAEGYELRPGARLSRPVNLDGHYNVRSFFNYGQPLNFISSNFNVNGTVGYSRIPGMIDEQINYANNTNLGAGINISSNISEKIDFSVSTFSSYNIVSNTLRTTQNNNYFNQNTSVRYNWILWKDLVYRTELNHQYNSGLSAGVDNSFLLWNMSLGKKIFKDKQGEISLSVNDLMNQNVSIRRNITESYVEDVQSTVLQRFFMLTFSYNIRSFKGAPATEENMQRGPGMYRGRPGSN
ncbi:TonB-dependent receptor [Pontibacter lucknowensis]|uniref:CarboxypepD_reg-like domain-containing protein n=1 Tax=Pontibacter lucknowensis TaxID=1077936 RepID=A0A1N6X794_9BACT|nr:TonB-dependent receptor [Pontibacter lucknowensis]SIQ98111.1 CarboxypepD_reg-like domain-containing protein [Pontibacter lucknowensis]